MDGLRDGRCEGSRPRRSRPEVVGHRGARGLFPENTLAGFRGAMRVGVDAIELDVVLTADRVPVVHHDLRLRGDIARRGGEWLGSAGPALAELPLDELRSFDVGRIDPRRGLARRFAEQASVDGQRVPTLRETLALFAEEAQGRVRMDLELKTEPGSAASPEPEALCEEVLAELRRSTAEGLVRLRSFDFRNLELVRRWAPELPLIALTHERAPGLRRRREPSPWTGRSLSDYGGSIPRMVRSVGAVGWAPAMVDLRWRELREARGLGLTVHPWTVNSVRVMRGLVRLRVDSITTDYPNRLRRVLASEGYELPPGGYEPPRAEGA